MDSGQGRTGVGAVRRENLLGRWEGDNLNVYTFSYARPEYDVHRQPAPRRRGERSAIALVGRAAMARRLFCRTVFHASGRPLEFAQGGCVSTRSALTLDLRREAA